MLSDVDGRRWVIDPPQDPYGDGYVYTATTQLHDEGMTAATTAKIEGIVSSPEVVTFAAYIQALADDWQGWDGIRTWQALERKLALDARHDGRGHVSLGVTLRAPGPDRNDTGWSARTVFIIEAGEEMTRLAADLTHHLSL